MSQSSDEKTLCQLDDALVAVAKEPFQVETAKQIVALALQILKATRERFGGAVDRTRNESAEARDAEARLAEHRTAGVVIYGRLLLVATSRFVELELDSEETRVDLQREADALPSESHFATMSIDDQKKHAAAAVHFGARVIGTGNRFVQEAERWLARGVELDDLRKGEKQDERLAITALQQQREDTVCTYVAARALVEAALRLERSRTPIERLMPSLYARRVKTPAPAPLPPG